MSRSYYDQKNETAALAETIMGRPGWSLTGYKADQSDLMTDYFDPAYWRGEAVFEPTGHRLVTRFSGAKEVPNGKSWALLDRDGKRVTCGVNVSRSGSSLKADETSVKLALLVEKIETACGRPPKRSAARLLGLVRAAEELRRAALFAEWPNQHAGSLVNDEERAAHARIVALADATLEQCAGATERDRRQTACIVLRNKGNRYFEGARRLLDRIAGKLRVLAV
jgi:hypothetical protein